MDGELTRYCPRYHRAAKMIARRWTPEIVRALLAGATRFGDFTAAIPGLSDRLLSERLKSLEAEGLVSRNVTPDTPVRIEYRLTDRGLGLAEAVRSLAEWAELWVTQEEPETRSR